MLNEVVKKYIDSSVLCWLGTSNNLNEPNVSPKELFTHSDKNTLLIANIASPNSVDNILQNPNVCLSFVNIFVQKGFKIKGVAKVIFKESADFTPKLKILTDLFTDEFPIHSLIEISISSIDSIQAPSYFLYPNRTDQAQIESAMQTYKVKPQ